MANKSRPLKILLRVSPHEKEELTEAVKQSGMNQQNYILSKLFSNFIEEDQETICPKCGGKLIPKKGYSGFFLVCEHFPSCSYTKTFKEEGE